MKDIRVVTPLEPLLEAARVMAANVWVQRVGLVILGLIAFDQLFRYLKYRKGSLRIDVAKSSFHFNEKISGTITVTARRTIVGRSLKLRLVCRAYSQDSEGHGQSRTVFESTHQICGPITFQEGEQRNLSFSILAPEKLDVPTLEIDLGALVGDTPLGQMIQRAAKVGSKMANKNRTWYLIVELDAEGLDLRNEKEIEVRKAA